MQSSSRTPEQEHPQSRLGKSLIMEEIISRPKAKSPWVCAELSTVCKYRCAHLQPSGPYEEESFSILNSIQKHMDKKLNVNSMNVFNNLLHNLNIGSCKNG